MKRMVRRVIVMVLTILLRWHVLAQPNSDRPAAPARIDATTQESFDRTFKEVEASVPANLGTKFGQAWSVLLGDTIERFEDGLPKNVALTKMMKAFDGKSAADVIDAAEDVVRRLIDEEARHLAKSTISELNSNRCSRAACHGL